MFSYSISSFSEGVILPVYAIFVQRAVGGSVLNAGAAMGVFLMTEGLFTIGVHRFAWSAEQRLNMMVIGWLVWVGGICAYLFVSNIWTLYLSQVLTAVGNALANPIFEQQLAAHTDSGLEQFEWGVFEGGKAFTDGSAAIIGGAIAAYLGFPILIDVMIGTATLSLILILVYVRELRGLPVRPPK